MKRRRLPPLASKPRPSAFGGPILVSSFLAIVSGCKANFVDERPAAINRVSDLGAPAGDALPFGPGADASGAAGIFAQGTFQGRAGHSGRGGAALFRSSDGSVELRFDADFSVTPVPGPEVVLTGRDSIGTAINPTMDLDLGPLRASSGAQAYPVPDDGGRRNAFVFCRPFGVEVAKAAMSSRP